MEAWDGNALQLFDQRVVELMQLGTDGERGNAPKCTTQKLYGNRAMLMKPKLLLLLTGMLLL